MGENTLAADKSLCLVLKPGYQGQEMLGCGVRKGVTAGLSLFEFVRRTLKACTRFVSKARSQTLPQVMLEVILSTFEVVPGENDVAYVLVLFL